MKFSVVLPTRNRPALFKRALASVLAQSGVDLEIIVVDDGSGEEHEASYREIEASAGPAVRFFHLVRTRGHGVSYALNFGAERASGDYLCFLDDDDEWTDSGHLARAAAVLSASPEPVDIYFANQAAVEGGRVVDRKIWIEDLVDHLEGQVPDAFGTYTVTIADLLKVPRFCHLNTTVMRRAFYLEIGECDENIRYECDREFYMRAIDRARLMKYSPAIVAKHHIPDRTKDANMSTAVSALEKKIFQVRVFDRIILLSRNDAIRRYGRRAKAYVLKSIAEELARQGRFRSAFYYAREALLVGFSVKWAGYSALLSLRALAPGASRRLD